MERTDERRGLLVLFDIDGTLFLTHDELFNRAAIESIRRVYGLAVPADAVSRVEHPGQTAMRITREILRRYGLDDRAIDAGMARWCEESSARYLQLLDAASTDHWRTSPGTVETLTALECRAHLALLTGNPEPIARARMERLGLASFFPPGQGAFGCEAEERPALIELARKRAAVDGAPWPAERTVLVGDTPADVAGADRAGVRCVAIASGRFERERLGAADAVIDGMPALPDALDRLERR